MALSDKQIHQNWKKFAEGIRNSTPIDTSETAAAKIARIARLEADPEEWFKYYFPKYAGAPPAQFHKDAAKRVIQNPEWVEVRSWSRELAKSTRTMMEIFYLVLVGNRFKEKPRKPKLFTWNEKAQVWTRKKQNVLIISNSKDNADRLLLPYMLNFEVNNRIINDYGEQVNIGSWTIGEFVTKSGIAFRALGAGQSPRGTRNEAIRPDIIVFDDLDTDVDCLNPDTIDKHWNWVGEAVIPTRSVSMPLLVIWCGNIIAEDCCVLRAQEKADHVDIVNLTDENGNSSWPEKNDPDDIKRIKDTATSYAALQKEYYNNPLSTGKTFPEIHWGKCPPLKELQFVVAYADPAPSNKDKPGAKSTAGNSRKAVFIVGRKGTRYYIYYGFLDVMGTDTFIEGLYACRKYVNGDTVLYTYIENNSLQDPFYDQVYRPAILAKGPSKGGVLGVLPDDRKKPEKWFRIEGTLEPINKRGDMVFNEDEKGNPHMQRLATQFKTAKATSRELDGPDCIQGAVVIIDEKTNSIKPGSIRAFKRQKSSSKHY